jgi:hypothetical protein
MMDSIGTCLCLLVFHVLFLLPLHGQAFSIHRLSVHTVLAASCKARGHIFYHIFSKIMDYAYPCWIMRLNFVAHV